MRRSLDAFRRYLWRKYRHILREILEAGAEFEIEDSGFITITKGNHMVCVFSIRKLYYVWSNKVRWTFGGMTLKNALLTALRLVSQYR